MERVAANDPDLLRDLMNRAPMVSSFTNTRQNQTPNQLPLLRPDLRDLGVGEKPRRNEDTTLRPVLLTLRRALRLPFREVTMDKTVTSFGEEAPARRKAMLNGTVQDRGSSADPQVEAMVNPMAGYGWIA
jgi:hypothetical protein